MQDKNQPSSNYVQAPVLDSASETYAPNPEATQTQQQVPSKPVSLQPTPQQIAARQAAARQEDARQAAQKHPAPQQLTPQQIDAIKSAWQARMENPDAQLTQEQIAALSAARQLKLQQDALRQHPAPQPVPQKPEPTQQPQLTQEQIAQRAHDVQIPEIPVQPHSDAPEADASTSRLEQMLRDKEEQERVLREKEAQEKRELEALLREKAAQENHAPEDKDESNAEEYEDEDDEEYEDEEEYEEPSKKDKLFGLLGRFRSSKKDEEYEEYEEDEDEEEEVEEPPKKRRKGKVNLDDAYVAPPGQSESDEELMHGEQGYHEPTVGQEVRSLVLKIVYVLAAFFIVFTFIFGLHRNLSAGMQPSLRDGDLLFYYRLDHDFRANNVVVFEYDDELIASRVIAVEGDTVNITDRGLEINGHVIYEPEIYSQTTQFKNGPTFPLTVEHDTVFCLGDNREHANDSRIIGLIEKKDIKGKVMGVIRRRNL